LRTSPDGGQQAVCLHNVAGNEVSVMVDLAGLGWGSGMVRDLIDGAELSGDNGGQLVLTLSPYGVVWLAHQGKRDLS
jgi:hypothetical protein